MYESDSYLICGSCVVCLFGLCLFSLFAWSVRLEYPCLSSNSYMGLAVQYIFVEEGN